MIANSTNTASQRKTIILREAARLFREKGYMASTLRELAKRSGVQGGSIYYHFSSKQEILYHIMDCTMTNLIAGLKKVVKEGKDPAEQLRKATKFHIVYHINNLEETHVTDAELRCLIKAKYDRIVNKRRIYENIFIRMLEEGSKRGLMNIGNVKLTSMAILQMCTGVSYWFSQYGSLNIHEIADMYVDFICWGVVGKVKISKRVR